MLKRIIFSGLMLLPGVLACGPGGHEAAEGFNMMGFGLFGFSWIVQLLVIIALGLGIALLVKNLKGGGKK